MITGSFDRIGAVAVSCDGQTGRRAAPSAPRPGLAGRVLCGRGAVPVLLLFAGMVWPGRGARPGGGCCSADGGQQPEVAGEAGEEEFAGGVVQAAEAEAAQPALVFEAGVQALDVGGAALVGGAAFGSSQPVRVGLGGGGGGGRGAFGGLAAGEVAGLAVGD